MEADAMSPSMPRPGLHETPSCGLYPISSGDPQHHIEQCANCSAQQYSERSLSLPLENPSIHWPNQLDSRLSQQGLRSEYFGATVARQNEHIARARPNLTQGAGWRQLEPFGPLDNEKDQNHDGSPHPSHPIEPRVPFVEDSSGQPMFSKPVSLNATHFQSPLIQSDVDRPDIHQGCHGHGDAKAAHSSRNPSRENRESSISDLSQSGRRHPVALDYKSTAKWLRDLFKNQDSYQSKLTKLPAGKRAGSLQSIGQRRPSEPLLPTSNLNGEPTQPCSQSNKSDPRFDTHVFKRAVNDLEALLNEVLNVASEAIDGSYPSSLREHSQCSSSTSQMDELAPDERRVESAKSTEVSDKLSNIALADDVPAFGHTHYDDDSYQLGQENFTLGNDYVGDEPFTSKHIPIEIPLRHSSKAHLTNLDPSIAGGFCSHGPAKARQMMRNQPSHVEKELFASSTTEIVDFDTNSSNRSPAKEISREATGQHSQLRARVVRDDALPTQDIAGRPMHHEHGINLRGRSHVSLRDISGFSLARSHKRQPIARDWFAARKRFVASVACISTALVGIILGIYAGLVPSIQYYIIDTHRIAIHGNTGCFAGLALPTLFLWPLPLLHGRKPYVLSSLVGAMPLLFLQAISINSQRLTNTDWWRLLLLVSRALMGASLGFATMNFHSTLTDLFGASLMSTNPHQEVVDEFDARRHGGGMGVWLGMWTWCWIGSLGVGFLIGAAIIDRKPPMWGFYVSIMLVAAVLVLNIISPEVRRSPFRRSLAEVRTGSNISRRLARGEIMMHRVKTGPKWWGQEVYHGICLSCEMLHQPGFVVMALYTAWIYAQVVLIIVLLGSLTSRFYRLRSPAVGLHVASVSLGALLAIPFQKANLFSRYRKARLESSRATLEGKTTWSSHLVRRAIFTILLPVAGIGYTLVSSGPPIHIALPTIFAVCMGFLSCLAISECNGIIMETYDTSDLSPGMTGRMRDSNNQKKTNYSAYPQVTAGFAIVHSLAFILAAGSTALGGQISRTLGQQVATGVVAGILLFLTALLLLVLIRFKNVLIIPRSRSGVMDEIVEARRLSAVRRASMPNDPQAIQDEEKAWQPVLIGHPIGKYRRMNLLELGSMTRWQEVRKQNELIDENAHLNRTALDQGLEALDDHMSEIRRDAHELLRKASGRKKASRHSHRSTRDSDSTQDVEMEAMSPNAQSAVAPSASQFIERDCFMGQVVAEQDEDETRGSLSGRGKE